MPFQKGQRPPAGDRPRNRRGDQLVGLARTAELPELVLEAGEILEEVAVPVKAGAELVGTSEQNLHQQILRGELAAYRHEDVRHVRLDDLVGSAPARRQAARLAAVALRQAIHEERRDHPLTDELVGERCAGARYEDCRVCRRGLDL
jgi:hypothetical protein